MFEKVKKIKRQTRVQRHWKKQKRRPVCKSMQKIAKFRQVKALKQKDSAETFCKEVEKMTNQLKILYIKEQIPAAKANEMAIKKGVL